MEDLDKHWVINISPRGFFINLSIIMFQRNLNVFHVFPRLLQGVTGVCQGCFKVFQVYFKVFRGDQKSSHGGPRMFVGVPWMFQGIPGMFHGVCSRFSHPGRRLVNKNRATLVR